MRKITLMMTLVTALALVFNSCKKKDVEPSNDNQQNTGGIAVEEKNTSVIHKFTGTNCYYCGDWGWPFFIDMVNQYHGTDAVCIGAYSQNQFAKLLINPFATAMDKRLPVVKGYPTFAGNFFDAWTGANTLQAMKDNIANAVNNHKNAPVIANSGLTFTENGNEIVVQTRTKFFQNADGVYNLSVIVLEDGVIAAQSGPNGGANASHKKVLRASNGDWGVEIANGAVSAGTTFDKEVTIAKDPSWNMANVELAILLWKKNGTKWDFVNAHLHKK